MFAELLRDYLLAQLLEVYAATICWSPYEQQHGRDIAAVRTALSPYPISQVITATAQRNEIHNAVDGFITLRRSPKLRPLVARLFSVPARAHFPIC